MIVVDGSSAGAEVWKATPARVRSAAGDGRGNDRRVSAWQCCVAGVGAMV